MKIVDGKAHIGVAILDDNHVAKDLIYKTIARVLHSALHIPVVDLAAGTCLLPPDAETFLNTVDSYLLDLCVIDLNWAAGDYSCDGLILADLARKKHPSCLTILYSGHSQAELENVIAAAFKFIDGRHLDIAWRPEGLQFMPRLAPFWSLQSVHYGEFIDRVSFSFRSNRAKVLLMEYSAFLEPWLADPETVPSELFPECDSRQALNVALSYAVRSMPTRDLHALFDKEVLFRLFWCVTHLGEESGESAFRDQFFRTPGIPDGFLAPFRRHFVENIRPHLSSGEAALAEAFLQQLQEACSIHRDYANLKREWTDIGDKVRARFRIQISVLFAKLLPELHETAPVFCAHELLCDVEKVRLDLEDLFKIFHLTDCANVFRGVYPQGFYVQLHGALARDPKNRHAWVGGGLAQNGQHRLSEVLKSGHTIRPYLLSSSLARYCGPMLFENVEVHRDGTRFLAACVIRNSSVGPNTIDDVENWPPANISLPSNAEQYADAGVRLTLFFPA